MSKDVGADGGGRLVPLPSLIGTSVIVTLVNEAADEVRGKVVAATGSGMIVRGKGSSKAVLVELHEIKSIEIDSDVNAIKQVTLKWPSVSMVRKHLATQHGWFLSDINKLSNQMADLEHKKIHASDYAHKIAHHHPGQEHLKDNTPDQ